MLFHEYNRPVYQESRKRSILQPRHVKFITVNLAILPNHAASVPSREVEIMNVQVLAFLTPVLEGYEGESIFMG